MLSLKLITRSNLHRAALPIPILHLLTLPQITPSSSSSSSSALFSTSSSSRSATPQATVTTTPPRQRYVRDVGIARDLPRIRSRTPLYIALVIASIISWGGFLSYATNNERANSTIVRSLLFQLKASPAVREFLGENPRLVPLFGEFRKVDGSINMLSGKIDVRFRVTGSQAKGTAIFTSVRRGKEGRFEVLRWKIARDDGVILDLASGDPRLVRGDGVGEL